MPLEKGFLRPKPQIDKYTLATGIMSGFLFSLSFYALLYMFREGIRIMTSWFGGMTLLELSPRENFLYNLFYAAIAVIFGLQVCLKFILENNINHEQKKLRFRQRQAVNDITSLSSVFLFFFAKTGTTLGIMFISIPLQYDIDFITEFPVFLILIPIALFLNIWMTITRTFGRVGYKWLFMSLVIVSVVSLLYAKINFLDYKTINESIKSNSVELSHKLDLPRTVTQQYLTGRSSRVIDLYVIFHDSSNREIRMFWKNARTEIKLSEISERLRFEKGKLSEYERDLISFNLHIDRNMDMTVVNDLKQELRKAGVSSLNFSTSLKNSKYPSHYPYFKRLGLSFKLYTHYPEFEDFLDSAEQVDYSRYTIVLPKSIVYRLDFVKSYNRVEIKLIKDSVLLNKKPISWEDLESLIEKLLRKYSPDFLIILSLNDQVTYDNYISLLDVLSVTNEKLKNEYALSNFNKSHEDFDDYYNYILYRDSISHLLNEKYPDVLIEWTKEEKRLINLMEKRKH